MLRPLPRLLSRHRLLVTPIPATTPARGRRAFSLAPPAQRSRSWKNAAVRWALALGVVYAYNNNPVLAEEPAVREDEESSMPTVDSALATRRRREGSSDSSEDSSPPGSSDTLAELEEESEDQGAFNPETGEINWDCPCLGGMAHGPCGEEFKAAFSCFVHSTEEPKGMDCIDKFKSVLLSKEDNGRDEGFEASANPSGFRGMQDCFRQHPDVYPTEEEDEEDEGPSEGGGQEGDDVPSGNPSTVSRASSTPAAPSTPPAPSHAEPTEPKTNTGLHDHLAPPTPGPATKEQPQETARPTDSKDSRSDDQRLVPKALHDEQHDRATE